MAVIYEIKLLANHPVLGKAGAWVRVDNGVEVGRKKTLAGWLEWEFKDPKDNSLHTGITPPDRWRKRIG